MEGHALDASSDPYAVFFTHAPRPMWIWDRQTFAFLDANVAAENMYGFSRDELLTMTVFDMRPAEEIPRLMERLRTDSSMEGVAWKHHRKDGSLLDAEIAEAPLLFGGRSARLAVVTDVTEREDAWRELSRSEQRFRQVFEASPVGIAVFAVTLHFIDANPALCGVLGYDRDEISSLSMDDVTYPEDRETSRRMALDVFEGRAESYGLEKRCVTKNGDIIWVYITTAAIRDPEGGTSYGLALIEDLTVRKRAEADRRRRAIEALETLSQLSERERQVMTLMSQGQTAADIARELTLSVRTVESHIAAAYRKLSVSRKEAALREYRRLLALTLQTPPDQPA
jgi:PAS domain S-box-containing protein